MSAISDELSDDDDDYFTRLADAAPSDELPGDTTIPPVLDNTRVVPNTEDATSESEYFSRYTHADSSLFADEGNLIWQNLVRAQVTEQSSPGAATTSATTIVKVASSSCLHLVKQFLFSHLPVSSKLFGALCHHIAKPNDTSTAFYTDNLLHPAFVLRLETTPSSQGFISLFSSHTLIESQISAIISFIYSFNLHSIVIGGCDVAIAEELKSRLNKRGATLMYECSFIMVTQLLTETEKSKLLEVKSMRRIPQECVIQEINLNDAKEINRLWAYGTPQTISMIQAMIGDNISAGIAAGQSLVSWALMYNEGSIGVVHTVEEHRGKGLARATLVHLLQKMYSGGSIEAPPYAFIDCQNTASRALFESLQFQKVADVMWMMFDLHTGRG